MSFPTPGKTVPHHPLGDDCQVTAPRPPLGDRTTTVHAHLQAQKLQHKTKQFSIRCVQRAANVRRPTPSPARGKILLPSAVHLEERLTVSQSVPEPRQQSVRKKHIVWVFCQWQMRPQAVGRPFDRRSGSGRVVKQPLGVSSAGGSNPGRVSVGAAAAAAKSQPTRIRTTDQKAFVGCVTIRPAVMC